MHYYQFNIADYRKDTGHLSMIEHAIYRALIDWYYLDEKPIPLETQSVMRRLRLVSEDEAKALENVLSDFFERADGWRHKRIDQDIIEYHAMAEKNKANGKLGGRPKKTHSDSNGLPNESQNNPNQEPLTNNQSKPKESCSPATRLPTDWYPSDDDFSFCRKERPDLTPSDVASRFRDYWIAQPGTKGRKADWHATWRNWVRNEKKINGSQYQTAKQATDSAQLRAIGWTPEMTQAIKDKQQGMLIEGTVL